MSETLVKLCNQMFDEMAAQEASPRARTCSASPIAYFVTYRSPDGTYGRCEMFRDAPVATIGDIESMEAALRRNHGRDDMVIGWRRFDDEPSGWCR